MWKKCDTAIFFFHFLHTDVEQVLFVRQECFSFLTPVHGASALERNTSSNPQSKWLHRSGAALSFLSLFGPCDLGAGQ